MIRATSEFLRLLRIQHVLIRHGLDSWVVSMHFWRPLRWLFKLHPSTWFRALSGSQGDRLRNVLEDLGPVFIKLGQLLSTRRDLLPDDITDGLARLQDQVQPFASEEARKIIEASLGKSIEEVFASFENTALASASIAQVHAATLLDGREVVVKVVRPGIRPRIRRDLALARRLAVLAERWSPEARRFHPIELVEDYERVILDELDMQREAASMSQVRRNFEGDMRLHVPEVLWQYSGERVLVMERIQGVPIGQVQRLKDLGCDMQLLAERGVEIFFTQVFRDNFFHADMHPGNIFVDVKDPTKPRYVAVDFGIMGSLTDADQLYLAQNLLAFFNRDYRKVARLHLESGWVPADARLDELEAAFRGVSEPIFERPFGEISFATLLLKLFRTGRRFGMEVQPQLVLLQKTLLYVEGLGKQLYPDLDLWTTAKPFLEGWLKERLGWRALRKNLREEGVRLVEQLPAIPGLLHDVLRKARRGELALEWKSKELERTRRELQRLRRTTWSSVIGGVLVLAGVISAGLNIDPGLPGGMWTFAGGLAAAGAILWLLAWPRDLRDLP
jgi:ubiquinone biosynthesis protein